MYMMNRKGVQHMIYVKNSSGTDPLTHDYLDFNLFNRIFPIGSIYMNINSTNPSEYFGGTWVQWEEWTCACRRGFHAKRV